MCRDAGLIRLGLVVLDGTKVKASASLEANRSAATVDASATEKQATGKRRGGRKPKPADISIDSDRLARPIGPESAL
jgi:hypothetical protein